MTNLTLDYFRESEVVAPFMLVSYLVLFNLQTKYKYLVMMLVVIVFKNSLLIAYRSESTICSELWLVTFPLVLTASLLAVIAALNILRLHGVVACTRGTLFALAALMILALVGAKITWSNDKVVSQVFDACMQLHEVFSLLAAVVLVYCSILVFRFPRRYFIPKNDQVNTLLLGLYLMKNAAAQVLFGRDPFSYPQPGTPTVMLFSAGMSVYFGWLVLMGRDSTEDDLSRRMSQPQLKVEGGG